MRVDSLPYNSGLRLNRCLSKLLLLKPDLVVQDEEKLISEECVDLCVTFATVGSPTSALDKLDVKLPCVN